VKKQHKEVAAAAAATPSGVVPEEDIFDDVGYCRRATPRQALSGLKLQQFQA
jgi:hypothetical protein